jgi:hypothetical protein
MMERSLRYSVSVVFPEFKTTRGDKEARGRIDVFGGKLEQVMPWDHDGKDALLVWFESELPNLMTHLEAALKGGYILAFNIRIAKTDEQKQKEKEEAKEESLSGWKEILTKDLSKIVTNREGEDHVSIEYNKNFGFTIKERLG